MAICIDALRCSGYRAPFPDAGWSRPVARWAHNPKVAGSNPAPATNSSHRRSEDFRNERRRSFRRFWSRVAEWIGVHAVVGAFLAGVALAQGREDRDPPTEVVHQFAIGIFAPIYFVSIGLKTDFAANFSASLALVVLLIACLGKIGGVTAGARLSECAGEKRWQWVLA